MNKLLVKIGLAMLLAGQLTAYSAEPVSQNEFLKNIRVSALLMTSDDVKVGLVNNTTKDTRFVGVGDKFGKVEILAADYDTEEVTVKVDGRTGIIRLREDPNAAVIIHPLSYPGTTNIWRGETIERLIRENPNAIVKYTGPNLKEMAEQMGPVTGFGPGIEKFLDENPQWRAMATTPAVGKGATIEKYLAEHPEIAEKANQPAVGKGEGIETYLREQQQGSLPPPAVEGFGPGIEKALQQQNELQSTEKTNPGDARGY